MGKDLIQEQRLNVVIDEKESPEPTAPPPSAEKCGATNDLEMKQKYDELVKYTLAVEKDKKNLEKQIADAQESKKKSGLASESGGFSLFNVLIVMLIAFLVPLL